MNHPRIERVELRADLFRSDLPSIVPRLTHQTAADRPHPDTISVFLATQEGDFAPNLRLRGYGDAAEAAGNIDAIRIAELYLESKHDHSKSRLGRVAAVGGVAHAGVQYTPASARITRREHFYLGESGDESRRLTLDTSRILYAIDGGVRLRRLGDLGPRIEIKSPDRAEADAVAAEYDLFSMGYALPYRSLELVLADRLRQRISPATYADLPETEMKYAVGSTEGPVVDVMHTFVDENDTLMSLNPPDMPLNRIRRYHICTSGDKVVTVVETMAGRFSLKQKTETKHTDGGLTIRTTAANHATDTTGALLSLDQFMAMHNLTHRVSFTKIQRKVPFYDTETGIAMHLTDDYCTSATGATFRQVELEFIGSIADRPDEDLVRTTMERVGNHFLQRANADGVRLSRTYQDKASYFLQT